MLSIEGANLFTSSHMPTGFRSAAPVEAPPKPTERPLPDRINRPKPAAPPLKKPDPSQLPGELPKCDPNKRHSTCQAR